MSGSNRRDFLKKLGKGALAAGMFMHLPNGAWLTADGALAAAPAEPGGERSVACDVLVVGGGYAACFAAIKAREQGAEVVMVDKGLAGRSGQSPWATSTMVFDAKRGDKLEDWMSEAHRECEYLNNPYWTETVIKNSQARFQDCIAWGLPLEEKNERWASSTGSFQGVGFGGRLGDLPWALRQHALKCGVKIFDRVMITELLKHGGRIVGAIGIPAGSFDSYTFTAKATVLCVGGCSYKPLNYPPGHQLTGDGEAMAYRAGGEILGKEFIHMMWTVRGLSSGGMATALPRMDEEQIPEHLRELRGASIMGKYLENAEGERLPNLPDTATHYPFNYLRLTSEVHAGRAPVYAVRPNGDKVELVGGSCLGMSIRNADGLWAADKECGTNLPGLYAAGDGLGTIANGAVYTMGGSSSMGAMVTGAIAGEAAAKEAAKMDKPAVNQEEIDRAREFVNMPTQRKGGFSPRWVTQLLQNTMAPYFVYSVKKADRLQGALTQIEFMQEHLVPMLIARDPHELRLAIETRSMVLSAEMRLRSGLFRTESRGNHYREDFPRRDDKNWMAWTKIKADQGRMLLTKEPIPEQSWPDASIPYEQRYPYRYPGE